MTDSNTPQEKPNRETALMVYMGKTEILHNNRTKIAFKWQECDRTFFLKGSPIFFASRKNLYSCTPGTIVSFDVIRGEHGEIDSVVNNTAKYHTRWPHKDDTVRWETITRTFETELSTKRYANRTDLEEYLSPLRAEYRSLKSAQSRRAFLAVIIEKIMR